MFIFSLAMSTVVFFLSLVVYEKIREKVKGTSFEWIFWLLFVFWTLGFGVGGMSIINESYTEFSKTLIVVPIALGFLFFTVASRKKISVGGFHRGNSVKSIVAAPDFSEFDLELSIVDEEIRIFGNRRGIEKLSALCIELLNKSSDEHVHLEDYQLLTEKSLKGVIALFQKQGVFDEKSERKVQR